MTSSPGILHALDRWREIRAEYEEHLTAAYKAAENATNGALLNERGKRAGIDAWSLFMGQRARAYAYASPELVEHWEHRPRVTFAQFEAERTETPGHSW